MILFILRGFIFPITLLSKIFENILPAIESSDYGILNEAICADPKSRNGKQQTTNRNLDVVKYLIILYTIVTHNVQTRKEKHHFIMHVLLGKLKLCNTFTVKNSGT